MTSRKPFGKWNTGTSASCDEDNILDQAQHDSDKDGSDKDGSDQDGSNSGGSDEEFDDRKNDLSADGCSDCSSY